MTLELLHQEFLRSKGICTDSRQDAEGSLFFALKGERFDGNQYVMDAIQAGCRLAITENEALKAKPGILYTPSPLKLLQDLASLHRRHVNPVVMAITGSNGKTTTKELVAAILSRKFSVLATRGNLNNHIGVPLTLLSLKDEQIAVIEMGANHPEEIGSLSDIAAPDLGLICNVGKAHLEGFGSLEGVLNAKGELYDFLAKSGGKAMVDSLDQMLVDKAEQSGVHTLLVGSGCDLPVEARILSQSPFLQVELEVGGQVLPVKTMLVGAYNLQNIKLAAATGYYFGASPDDIAGALASYRPTNQRSQLIEGGKNRVILDSYNANPSSMREAVSAIIDYTSGPSMLILGDMAEVGESWEEEHRDLVRWIRTLKVDQVLLAGPNFYHAIEPSGSVSVFKGTSELGAYLKTLEPEGYNILVKGSRVMEMERLTPLLVHSA